eukprot:gene7263-biopygen3630
MIETHMRGVGASSETAQHRGPAHRREQSGGVAVG